jgi:hypothetical protein
MSRTIPHTTFKEVTQVLAQYNQGLVSDAELLIHVMQLNGVQLAALTAHLTLPYAMQQAGLDKWDDRVADWMARGGYENPKAEDFLTGRLEKRQKLKPTVSVAHGQTCRCHECDGFDN